jgi:hypothetical protein
MGRISIFEFEDFSWYPAALRDLETDLLQFWISLMGLYDASVPQLTDLLARAEASEVVDLCSGGAGPWIKLKSKLEGELGRDLSVTLSDKFPNVPAFERARRKAGVKFESEPVDATRVPDKLKGVRTLYSCFHHFPPELAKSILRDAQKSGVPIAIFEGTARLPREFFRFTFMIPFVWAVTPFVRPFKLSRFLFTYAIPIVPFVGLWNGMASNMRTYSPVELQRMTEEIASPDYRWEVGRLKRWLLPTLTYLIGSPVTAEGPSA